MEEATKKNYSSKSENLILFLSLLYFTNHPEAVAAPENMNYKWEPGRHKIITRDLIETGE